MLLYVVAKAEAVGARSLTRTKLAKVLWYSDFGAYRDTGQPISGWPYVKQPHGPMPDQMLMLELDLEADGRLLRHREGNATRYSLGTAQADPASGLEPDERAYVDHVLYVYRNAWASFLSSKSHEESVGWQAAALNEEIPYSTALLSRAPLTDREIARGQELAHEFGWTT